MDKHVELHEWDHHNEPEHQDKRSFCAKLCCCPHPEDPYESDDEGKGPEDSKYAHPDFRKTIKSKGPDGEERDHFAYDGQYTRVRKTGRCPTDIPCTILFIIFLVVMIGIMAYGFYIGRPERLYYPTDYTGRICGADNSNAQPGAILFPADPDCQNAANNATSAQACYQKTAVARINLSNQKYLWFMDLSTGVLTYGGVCVSYCPGAGGPSQRFCPPELNQTQLVVFNYTLYQYCTYTRYDLPNVTFPTGDLNLLIASSLTYQPLVFRCVPTFKYYNSTLFSNYKSILNSYFSDGYQIFGNLINDVYRSWPILVISVFIALIFSFSYLAFLRLFAGIVTWFTIIALFILTEGLGAFTTWYGWTTWQTNQAEGLDVVVPKIFFGVGISILVIGLIYIVAVVFMAIRIRKAIGMIQESTKAIGAMPHIVFVPFFTICIVLIYFSFWLCIAGFLWSSGIATIEGYTVRFKLDYSGNVLFYIHIFGLLWIVNLMEALCHMIVAGAVGAWYWKRNKKLLDPRAFYIAKSTYRAIVFHFGTVAFGSLIVAIVQFIRILFEKFYSELKKAHANNKIWKYAAWAVRAFLFIFELIIKYINKHAYVQTALYGTMFITSAINAFTILTRNFLQIGVLQTITTFVLLLGKLLVSVFTCFVGYALAYSGYLLIVDRGDPISSPLLVAIICFIIAFIVSSIFVRIVDTAIDTILQCFLVDYEMCYNDENRKPFCTRTLAIFIKEQRAIDKLERFVCQCCCCVTGGCCHTSDDPQNEMGRPPVQQ